MTPGSPTRAPQDDAQPTEAHGDGGDAGRSPVTRWVDIIGIDPEYVKDSRPNVDALLGAWDGIGYDPDDDMDSTDGWVLRVARLEGTVTLLTAERDRARATAVTLEQELADAEESLWATLQDRDDNWDLK